MKNIQKTNKICYCLGGGNFKLGGGGGYFSPKSPEKKHCFVVYSHTYVFPENDICTCTM